MKLIIQIPCLNEEASIGRTLDDLPKTIQGIDSIATLIIDDGSTDNTVETALAHGAGHILPLKLNRGLAGAFRAGIEESLKLGADIIVNTDGDNQYCGKDIEKLVKPILDNKADFVIGVRDIRSIRHFSRRKKFFQHLGSWVVRQISSTAIRDVTSGFRAFSRSAALKLNLVTDYTHTLETIILLGKERVAIAQVNVKTNEKIRESRLMSSTARYVVRCAADLMRIYIRYEAFKTFAGVGVFSFLIAVFSGLYYLVNRLTAEGRSWVALTFFSLFSVAGLLFIILGFLGDCIACNRQILDNISRHLRHIQSSCMNNSLKDKSMRRNYEKYS